MSPSFQESFRKISCGIILASPPLFLGGWIFLPPSGRLFLFLFFVVINAPLYYGIVAPNSRWFGPVAKRFQTTKKEVWLTFDDGPDRSLTPAVLDLLDRYHAKATFFVIGNRVQSEPELVCQILERGHTLGNHTQNHLSTWFWGLTAGIARREIAQCSKSIITATAGEAPISFRSPVGMTNPMVHKAIQQENMRLIGWSARGYDTVNGNAPEIVERILKDLQPGSIILLHPEHRKSRGIECLELLLQKLREEEYRCVIPQSDQLV